MKWMKKTDIHEDVEDNPVNLGESDLNNGHIGMQTYFKRLKVWLVIGLLIAFMIPHIVLSAYFHFQFTSTLKDTGKLNLEALAVSQKNTIDLFLQERVVNLFSLFHRCDFSLEPSERKMENYLQNLRQVSEAFIDVGFFNPEGIQIGYAGPYAYLHGKDYSNEKWFKNIITQKKDYHISDIYLGFRNKPHFTIAVRQIINDRYYIMRSTLDPDKFYMFLRAISQGKGVSSELINTKGIYQLVDPGKKDLLEKSDFIPLGKNCSGVKDISKNSKTVLVAYAWLNETPWALLVRQPLNLVHARMYQTRRILTAGQAILSLVIGIAIWLTVSSLMDRSRMVAETRDRLQFQLVRASKMASIGELSTGVAHEINNPLAIITSTTGVIRDLFDPEFGLDSSPINIIKELDIIDTAAFRAQKITHQLLDFGRKETPRLVLCNINSLFNDVISGLKEREFKVKNIEIENRFDPDIPEIMIDPDQIRQVLLNIINNAGDAMDGSGTLTLSTSSSRKNVRVTISDTGEGMAPEQVKQIFNPFYSTKEIGKGTGLGLSVSLSIVESMGGTIDVQSLKGSGSSFTITLPIEQNS